MDSEDDIEMASPCKLLPLPGGAKQGKDKDFDDEDIRKSLRKLKIDLKGEDSPSSFMKRLADWRSKGKERLPEPAKLSLEPDDSKSSTHYVEVDSKSENSHSCGHSSTQQRWSPKLNAVIYYDSDGFQTQVKNYREGMRGIGIGFTDDGRVLIAKPNASQTVSTPSSVNTEVISPNTLFLYGCHS